MTQVMIPGKIRTTGPAKKNIDSMERLDKLIASQGTYSRREVQNLIKNSRVTVNGIIVRDRGCHIDPDCDSVCIDNERLIIERFVYLMLNKPLGVVSATNDPHNRTVVDLAPEKYRKRNLFPAGRLDMTTTGFVLLTDDGDFAHEILSPKNHVEKTYEAVLAGPLSDRQLAMVSEGITLGNGEECLPAKVRILTTEPDTVVEVKICEGKYHQIRRMFAAAGNGVVGLKRTAMGKLRLDESLEPGKCRLLTPDEVSLIKDKN